MIKKINNIITNKNSVLIAVFIAILLSISVKVFLYPSNIKTISSTTTGTSINFSPNSGTYTSGQKLTITLYENSGTTAVNTVEADFTYPSNLLSYVAADYSQSKFEIGALSTISNGQVKIARGTTNASLTGNDEIGQITFQVISNGSASLIWQNSSGIASTASNQNVLNIMNNASYNIVNSVNTKPVAVSGIINGNSPSVSSTPPSAAQSASSVPNGQTTHIASNSTGQSSNSTNNGSSLPFAASANNMASSVNSNQQLATKTNGINLTYPRTNTSINIPNSSPIKASTSVNIQPSNISNYNNPVVSVQYLLDNKLLANVTRAPFQYQVDSHNLLNGKYNLTMVTHYMAGNKTTDQHQLIVANPASFNQFRLTLAKYALSIILALVIIMAVFGYFYNQQIMYILHKAQYYIDYTYKKLFLNSQPLAVSSNGQQVPNDLDFGTNEKDSEHNIDINKFPPPKLPEPGSYIRPIYQDQQSKD